MLYDKVSVESFKSVLDEYEDSPIQALIEQEGVGSVFDFQELVINSAGGLINIEDKLSKNSFTVKESEIVEITDMFFTEEINWREAAYEVKCKNNIKIHIDILDN
ncbi:hypothetical protein V1503_23835 [Bacillus sp. SCS-151]|uniref:hypothetical protein n=1 Tax=Nanhaiella sioensis TaxID=3115293 RepID=UPI0039793D11